MSFIYVSGNQLHLHTNITARIVSSSQSMSLEVILYHIFTFLTYLLQGDVYDHAGKAATFAYWPLCHLVA